MGDLIERIDILSGEIEKVEKDFLKCSVADQRILLKNLRNISVDLAEIYNEFCYLEAIEN